MAQVVVETTTASANSVEAELKQLKEQIRQKASQLTTPEGKAFLERFNKRFPPKKEA